MNDEHWKPQITSQDLPQVAAHLAAAVASQVVDWKRTYNRPHAEVLVDLYFEVLHALEKKQATLGA